VPEYPEKNRECFLSIEEYSRLFDAMTAIERESGRNCPSPALACVRLLALTGARKSEIQTLKWSFVDLKHGVLRLPDSKTGAKVISLPDAALELLAALPRLSAYVMPGDKDGTTGDDGKPVEAHFVGIQKAWQRIRARAGLGHVRLHDLRHAFASLAATTDRYAHLSVDPIRAMVGRTAEKISAVSKAA
jgi:integrase